MAAPSMKKNRRRFDLRRFWLAAGLLGLGPWSAAAQDLVVRVEAQPARIFLTRPLNQEVRLNWSLNLGPTRYLVVESRSLVLSGASLPRSLQRLNATGVVRFQETVSPAELQNAVGRGGQLTFFRRFVARSAAGGNVSGEGVVTVEPVDLNPTAGTVSAGVCSRTVNVSWSLNTGADRDLVVVGAVVTSPDLTSSGIARRRWLGRPIPETVTVSSEAIAGALRSGSPIPYSRSFDFYFKGELLGRRSGTAEIGVEGFEVTANPASAVVTVGTEVTIPVTWSAESCQRLSSTAGELEAGGEVLRTTAGAMASESLRVPSEVSLRARNLGASQIRYVRGFTDQFGNEEEGELFLRLVGSVTGEFAVRRLALQFDDGESFRLAERRERLSALAEITYAGSGLLQAEWEAADPSSTLGEPVFRPLGVVRRHLPAGGRLELRSPGLPTDLAGTYGVRLVISEPSTAFDETPVLPYQVLAGDGEFKSRVGPRPPPWDEAPRVREDDPRKQRELVAFTADMDEAKRLDQIGLRTKLRYSLDALDLVVSVLRVPAGAPVGELLDELRRRHPTLWIDANHLYKAQQSIRFDPSTADPAPATEEIGWGQAQRECSPDSRIGIVDTPVGDTIPPRQRNPIVLTGEETTTEHGSLTAALLTGRPGSFEGLLSKAKEVLFAAEALSRPDELSLTRGWQHVGSLDRLARAFDWLLQRQEAERRQKPKPRLVINVGVAGKPGLGLRLITWWTVEHEGVYLVAPYGDDKDAAYPAAYEWVFGTAAEGFDSPRPEKTIFTPQVLDANGNNCGNSCSAPLVTAALWIAVGSDGDPLGQVTDEDGLRLRAPPCAPGN